MKPVLAWMKANLTIVILSVVILLVLPAAFVGSHMWNKKIRTTRETAANKKMTELGGLRVSYVLPPAFPGGPSVTVPMDAPNPGVTEFFKKHRGDLEAQITQVAEVAMTINSQGHEQLVPGLLPEVRDKLNALLMVDALVGKDGNPSAYEKLLSSINAGPAADPVRVAEALKEERDRFIEAVRARSNREQLTPEEQTELTEKLTAIRIGMYQSRAEEIAVYATKDCLPKQVPRVAPLQTPDEATVWEWQFDYWMTADLLRAIDAANHTSAGQRTTVDRSVVKRIVKLTIEPRSEGEVSITGRANSTENKLYDVRTGRMSLIVASARIPDLINAISRTNFMSVTGLDIKEGDPYADLEDGFYYGPDHVVEANIEVETVWLRNWTEALMPPSVREEITGVAADPSMTAAPPPPPAAETPRSGRGAAPEPKGRGGRGGDDGGW